MNFSIDAVVLLKVVKSLGVVAKLNVSDYTGLVLIESSNNSVNFVVNNGIVALTFLTEKVEIREPGAISIGYGQIKSFVSSYRPWDGSSGAKNFEFISDGRNLDINVDVFYAQGKPSKGILKTPTSNPSLVSKPQDFKKESFILNSAIFKEATNKVLYAVNPQSDIDHPALRGMLLKFTKDNIYFAGSNGIVLSEFQMRNNSNLESENIILQYDFVAGLKRLLTDGIQMSWELTANRVAVRFNEITLFGRKLIGHDYPEYRPIFDNFTNHINLSKEFLIDSISPFMDILVAEDNHRLTIEIKDKVLSIYNDQANISSELDGVGGFDFAVDINGRHLFQTIEAIRDDHILFKFKDRDKKQKHIILDSSNFNDQKSLVSTVVRR